MQGLLQVYCIMIKSFWFTQNQCRKPECGQMLINILYKGEFSSVCVAALTDQTSDVTWASFVCADDRTKPHLSHPLQSKLIHYSFFLCVNLDFMSCPETPWLPGLSSFDTDDIYECDIINLD